MSEDPRSSHIAKNVLLAALKRHPRGEALLMALGGDCIPTSHASHVWGIPDLTSGEKYALCTLAPIDPASTQPVLWCFYHGYWAIGEDADAGDALHICADAPDGWASYYWAIGKDADTGDALHICADAPDGWARYQEKLAENQDFARKVRLPFTWWRFPMTLLEFTFELQQLGAPLLEIEMEIEKLNAEQPSSEPFKDIMERSRVTFKYGADTQNGQIVYWLKAMQ
jgi:hypothetical protein